VADRRMFTKKVTDDDNFMSLSSSAQALYLHLMMSADDDGFSNQVNVSMFKAHASVQDLQALLEKRYLYQFENGVIVIKHWRMANALRKDRYTPTAFQEELAQLDIKDNGSYTLRYESQNKLEQATKDDGCRLVANWLPQDRVGKDKEEKNNNILYSLILKDGSEYPITEDDLKGWEKNFPSLDVRNEFLKMQSWCESNPSKRKTKTGIKRFINGWLSKVRPLKASDYEEVLPNWMTQQEEEELPEWMTPEMREEWQKMKTSKKQTTS